MSTEWNLQPEGELERQLLDVAELALSSAASQGATMAEMTVGQGEGMSVTVRQGDVETVEHNQDKSMVVNVFFDQRSGSATTTDFSEKAIMQTVESACSIAKYTEADEFSGLADPDRLAKSFKDLDLHHPWSLSMDQAIEIATECEQTALEYDSLITNTEGATLSSHQGTDLYANSMGFRGLSNGTRHSNSCSVIGELDGSMQRDYWYDSCRDASELNTPRQIGEETAKRTLRRLGARKIKTGQYPIIFEAPIASSLLGHLISAVSGSSLYKKASFLVDHLGESIFQDTIRIHEQPFLPKGSSSTVFDSEGVATAPREIVNQGVLSGYVLNSYAARKLGMESTGNAGGVHNLTIDPTTDVGLTEMLQQMDTGLLVTELIGHGINNVTGDYSRGAFGFWVKNGEIQYPVHEFTIAGNLKTMFNQMSLVGNDVNHKRSILCGSIMIDEMTVAGG